MTNSILLRSPHVRTCFLKSSTYNRSKRDLTILPLHKYTTDLTTYSKISTRVCVFYLLPTQLSKLCIKIFGRKVRFAVLISLYIVHSLTMPHLDAGFYKTRIPCFASKSQERTQSWTSFRPNM